MPPIRRTLGPGQPGEGPHFTQDDQNFEFAPPPGPPPIPFNLKPTMEGLPPRDDARGGETPRERERARRRAAPQTPPGGAQSAPPMPSNPTPQAGGVTPVGPPPPPPVPFNPMPNTSDLALTTPMGGDRSTSYLGGAQRRGLLGGAGGLTGGGLGVPFDPVSNQQSTPIDTLIKLLARGQ